MFKNWVVWEIGYREVVDRVPRVKLPSGDSFITLSVAKTLEKDYTVLRCNPNRCTWLVTYKQFPYNLIAPLYRAQFKSDFAQVNALIYLEMWGIIDLQDNETLPPLLPILYCFKGLWHRIAYRNDAIWKAHRNYLRHCYKRK